MSIADWISVAAAAIAGVGVFFAIREYRHAVRERIDKKRAELDAVAVAWHPRSVPNQPHGDGTGLWKYEVTVQNPGHFPIRDVVVELQFGLAVQRRHYDGVLDAPRRSLEMEQPVVLPGGSRTWTRNIVLPFEARHQLRNTTADVTFTTSDGTRRTNHMDGRPPTVHGAA
ncbi:hypothetical protein [Isoptericola variabilis]|uniref:Uncharacterized protein n=1 Tax=Isoptericola variabilis (strain 225) TaxID=743718 RepID=F6FTG7_ISOV2|nr:hypothetical protein [Isoptericola variabilis]AEG43160.1 hypothetical protein Isova_0361 [Isoptericola variabilis 225]TWH35091.1 hypothetical protein L600_000100000950 [Isoptericola variabilis J7]